MALLLVAVTGAGLLYWLHEKPISLDQYKSYLADDLSEAFGGRDVRISNLRFGFPPNASFPVLTADRLDVLGNGGRSLFGADDITLGVKFSELLLGRVDLSDLSLGEVRLPISLADGTDQTRGFMQRLDGLFETLQELLNDDVGAGLDGIALDRLVLAGRFQSGVVLNNILVTKQEDLLSVAGNIHGGQFILSVTANKPAKIGLVLDGAELSSMPFEMDLPLNGRLFLGGQLIKNNQGFVGNISARIENGLYDQMPINASLTAQLSNNLLVISEARGSYQGSNLALTGIMALEPGEEAIMLSGDGALYLDEPLAAPIKMDLPGIRARVAFDGSISGNIEMVYQDLVGFVRLNHGNGQPFLDGRFENLPVSLIHKHWPILGHGNTHAWLNEHVEKGMISNIALSMDKFGDRPSGFFSFDNLSMNFLDNQLQLTVPNGVADLDDNELRFQLDAGRLNELNLGKSLVVLKGLYDEDQSGVIDATALGDLAQLKDLLTLPRIGALTPQEAQEINISSKLTFQTLLELPLIADLTFDDVRLKVSGVGRGVTIPIGEEAKITSPKLDLAWEKDSPLTFQGPVNWKGMSFGVAGRWLGGEGIQARLTCPNTNAVDIFAALDIKNGDQLVSSKLDCRIKVEKPDQGPFLISGDIRLLSPQKGPLGQLFLGQRSPVRASFSILETANKWSLDLATDADPINIFFSKTGRQDQMTISGLKSAYISDGILQVLSQQGRTNLKLSGTSLDVARVLDDGLLDGDGALNSALRLRFKRLLMPAGLDPLIDANLSVIGDGKGATVVAGQVGSGVTLSLTVPEEGPLKIVSANSGSLLRMLGIVEDAEGGRLNATISTQKNGISGELSLEDVRVTQMPVLLRLLSVASLQGLADGLRGQGVRFDVVRIPFEAGPERISIIDALAKGPSIGLTLAGTVEGANDARMLDLRGVLIPVYGVNSFIGQVPIIGDLVTGGERSGFISINYKLQGPTNNPSASVNPVTSVIPGPIKRLFGIE